MEVATSGPQAARIAASRRSENDPRQTLAADPDFITRSTSGPAAASDLASMLNRAVGNSSSRSAISGIGSVPPIRARRTSRQGSAPTSP